jgi:hypothetical protein
MGALLTEGCDLYGTDETKAEAYGWQRMNGTQEACLPTGGRYGGPCFSMDYSHNGWRFTIKKAGVTTLYAFRSMKFQTDTFASTYGIFELRNNDQILMARVNINSARQIVIYDADSAIQATSTETLPFGIYHGVQAKFVCHATTGSIEVWANGVQYAIATNIDTMPSSGNQYVEIFTFGKATNDTVEWMDDPCLWDDSGSDWNDWTEGKDLLIETLYPNADTAQEDFIPLSAGDQFAEVNETPDHDADVSYNGSTNAGDKDRLGLEPMTGIPSVIYNVRSRIVAKKTNAGAANAKVGVFSGATEDVSAAQGLASDYTYLSHDNEVNPDDSLPWEKTDIDALQVQYESA